MLVAGAFVAAYIPTLKSLVDGPWRTEQEGHGPLIIAAALWLAWRSHERLRRLPSSSAPLAGWIILIFGLVLMFLARTQGVLTFEALSAIPVIIGSVVALGGWGAFRLLAFPIFFLLFAVPVPDWFIDAATIPLKVLISDVVTQALYTVGYPVAQNGVMIMIGPYQLMVKDACSGMNSIFALSAIGVFYVYVFRSDEKLRSLLLLASIVPITIAANFIRVLALVLLAYHVSVDAVEGTVHDLTGIGLFIIAVALLFLFDGFLGVLLRLFGLERPKSIGAPISTS